MKKDKKELVEYITKSQWFYAAKQGFNVNSNSNQQYQARHSQQL